MECVVRTMKTKLTPLIILLILVVGFLLLSYVHYIFYKTWGNNEHYYLPVNGMEIICDVNLWQNPSNCNPVNEKGKIIKWPENYGHMGNKENKN